MRNRPSAAAIRRAAAALGCTEPAVRAVIEVEAGGDGFLPDGRPKILFERHKFRQFTKGRFDQTHPTLSGPAGNYSGGTAEYVKLYQALQLDAEAAIQSCSWGIAQIMGFNWPRTGETSLLGFLMAMHHDADAQLALMVEFIRMSGLADEMKRKDWTAFARGYNGPAQKGYDTKLQAAYKRHGGT